TGECEQAREHDQDDDEDVERIHGPIVSQAPRSNRKNSANAWESAGVSNRGHRGAARRELAPAGAMSKRARRSPRCAISRIDAGAPSGARVRAWLERRGIQAAVKPSFPASLSRASACATGRTSPESPISPKTTVSAGTRWCVAPDTTR